MYAVYNICMETQTPLRFVRKGGENFDGFFIYCRWKNLVIFCGVVLLVNPIILYIQSNDSANSPNFPSLIFFRALLICNVQRLRERWFAIALSVNEQKSDCPTCALCSFVNIFSTLSCDIEFNTMLF